MTLAWLTALTGFSLVMTFTPGPNNAMAAASGATFGFSRTIPLIGGITFGIAAIILAVTAFGASIVSDARVASALTWVGIIYLIWLAFKIATTEPHLKSSTDRLSSKPLTFIQGSLFQLVNPKLWVMVSGAVVTYGQTSGEMGRVALVVVFTILFGSMTFASAASWAFLGSTTGRFLASAGAVRTFNITMALLLLASIAPIVNDQISQSLN